MILSSCVKTVIATVVNNIIRVAYIDETEPVIISVDTDSYTFTEESVSTSTVVGLVSASDVDGGTIVYSLTGAAFTDIDSSTGVITLNELGVSRVDSGLNIPTFKAKATSDNSYIKISVNVSDTITVNDDIVFVVENATSLIEDSVTTDTIVATITATDEDGGDVVITLDDSTYVSLTDGVITLNDSGVALINSASDLPDFSVTATSENSTLSTTISPVATTTVNDDIVFVVENATSLIEDSVTTDTIVATITATDEDGGDVVITLDDSTYVSLTDGVITLNDSGVALINSGSDLPDFSVTATSDNSTLSTTISPIATTTVNDDIVLVVENATSFIENSVTTDTIVANIIATDEDEDSGDVVITLDDSTYVDISDGIITLNDSGAALINSGSDLPEFSVTATSDNSTISTTISPIATTTVNDDIVLSIVTANAITQITTTSDVIATVTASDEDGSDLTYSLSDNDDGYYSITDNLVYLTSDGVDYVGTKENLPDFTVICNSTTGETSTVSENVTLPITTTLTRLAPLNDGTSTYIRLDTPIEVTYDTPLTFILGGIEDYSKTRYLFTYSGDASTTTMNAYIHDNGSLYIRNGLNGFFGSASIDGGEYKSFQQYPKDGGEHTITIRPSTSTMLFDTIGSESKPYAAINMYPLLFSQGDDEYLFDEEWEDYPTFTSSEGNTATGYNFTEDDVIEVEL